MKTHEQINYACSKGLYPIVQKEDGEVCIFSPYIDENGYYRDSGWLYTQEGAEKWIGDNIGYTPEEMKQFSQEQNWKIIGYYETPYEKYEVGDKVVVKETGKVGVVEVIFEHSQRMMVRLTKSDYDYKTDYDYYIHSQLLPYFDTTPSEEEIEKAKKTLEDAGLLLDGKVLKK